jgi:hypothetical protein
MILSALDVSDNVCEDIQGCQQRGMVSRADSPHPPQQTSPNITEAK